MEINANAHKYVKNDVHYYLWTIYKPHTSSSSPPTVVFLFSSFKVFIWSEVGWWDLKTQCSCKQCVCMCMCVCVCVCVRARVCVCVRACVCVHKSTHTHTHDFCLQNLWIRRIGQQYCVENVLLSATSLHWYLRSCWRTSSGKATTYIVVVWLSNLKTPYHRSGINHGSHCIVSQYTSNVRLSREKSQAYSEDYSNFML